MIQDIIAFWSTIGYGFMVGFIGAGIPAAALFGLIFLFARVRDTLRSRR